MIHTCEVKTVAFRKIQEDEQYQTILSGIEAYSRQHSFERMRKELAGDLQTRKVVYQEQFSLPCKRTFSGLYTIKIKVEGRLFRFVIDTGAQVSGIRQSVAERLGLAACSGSLSLSSISGKQQERNGYVVRKLYLGKIAYYDYPMIMLRDEDFCIPHTKIPLTRMDGIIGWDLLHELDFEIDTIAHVFHVLKNTHRFLHRNFISGTFPVVVALDGEKQYYFGIDTGASIGWLAAKNMSGNPFQQSGTIKTMGIGVHGLERMETAYVKEVCMQVDRAEIHLQGVIHGRCDMYAGILLDGVFGNEIFAGRRIRFLNSAQVVLLV